MTNSERPNPPGRKIPPLVWIIAVILLGIVAYTAMTYGGSRPLPGGDSYPQAKPEPSVMPASPPPPGT